MIKFVITSGFFLSFIIIFFAIPFLVYAEELSQKNSPVMTLDWCLEKAIKNNPTLKSARLSILKYDARAAQIFSEYSPQISLSSSLVEDGSWQSRNNSALSFSNTISLSQYISDFGKTSNRLKAAREEQLASVCDYKISENNIIFEVKQGFYRYIESVKLHEAEKEYLEASSLHLEKSKLMYENGLYSKIEVTASELDFQDSSERYIQTENKVKTARLALIYAIGYEDKNNPIFEDILTLPEITGTAEDFLRVAYENNPEVQKTVIRERAAKALLDSIGADKRPELSSYARMNSHNSSNRSSSGEWNIGLNLKFKIFDGGYRNARIREAQYELDMLKASNERILQRINYNLKTEYQNAKDLRLKMDIAAKALEQAEENFRLATSRYNEGVGSNLEYRDAKTALIRVKTSYISTTVTYLIAIANLEQITGVKIDSLLNKKSGAILL